MTEFWNDFETEEKRALIGQGYDAQIESLRQEIHALEREKEVRIRESQMEFLRWREAIDQGLRSLNSQQGFQRFVSTCSHYPHWSPDNQLALIGQVQGDIDGLMVAPLAVWKDCGYQIKRNSVEKSGVIRTHTGRFLSLYQRDQVSSRTKKSRPSMGQAWVLDDRNRRKLPDIVESIARQSGVLIRTKHQIGRSLNKRPYTVVFDHESGRLRLTFFNKRAPTELPMFRTAMLQSTLKTTRDEPTVAITVRAVEEIVARAVGYHSGWKPRDLKHPTGLDSNDAYRLAHLISINANVMVSHIHQLSGSTRKLRPKLLNPDIGLEANSSVLGERNSFIDTSLIDNINSASSGNVVIPVTGASSLKSSVDSVRVDTTSEQKDVEL